MNDDILICFGGEVKAVGDDGRIEGYLVRFSGPKDPDISATRDFFTKETDFDLERSTKTTIYFDHGLDGTMKRRKLGLGEMKIDDVGVWVSGVLNRRDKYEDAIYQMARAGKLGWSSGTAIHLCEREKMESANKIMRWPLGLDASLTPTPAEPRNAAVTTLKGYVEVRPSVKFIFDDFVPNSVEIGWKAAAVAEAVAEAKLDEPASLDLPDEPVMTEPPLRPMLGDPTTIKEAEEVVKTDETPAPTAKSAEGIKGIFETALAEYMDEQKTPWMLVNAFERAYYRICEAAEAADLLASTIDFNGLIDEAVNEFASRLREWGRDQLAKMREGGMAMAPSYLSLRSPLKDLVEMRSRPQVGVKSEIHSETVLAAVEEFANEALTLVPELKAWVERRKSIAALRADKLVHPLMSDEAAAMKVGRVISSATAHRMGKLRKKIAAAMQEMQTMDGELDELMSMAKPKEKDLEDSMKSAEAETPVESAPEETKSVETETTVETPHLAAALEMEYLRFNSIPAVGVR